MLPEYRTIYQGGEDEIVEKKSRFIATVIPVENEEEALEFIEKTKKKYWDARHNCFASVSYTHLPANRILCRNDRLDDKAYVKRRRHDGNR